jgi:hypothetical protein
MTTPSQPNDMLLSLIAAGTEEHVPSGVPYGAVSLPSLDTDEVRRWLEENRQFAVYVIAGTEHGSDGVPAISVAATQEDYERVLTAMPR